MEHRRSQQYRNDAKTARQNNPSLIFKDLQEPLAESVETLLESVAAEVSGTYPDDLSVTLVQDTPFREDLPLLTKTGPTCIVHAEPDKVWYTDLCGAAEGDIVRQERYLGSLTELFRAFGDAWSRRWLKHEVQPDVRWEAILEGVCGVPPEDCMQCLPISLATWRQAVRDKHPRTSAGPDGISRLDLLAMPDDLTILVIDICHYAESTGRWPRSALQEVITAIQKAQSSASVGDFRPITIFSLIYGCWSSIRARQCLAYLDGISPPGLVGNRPGLSASSIWYSLQSMVDSSSLQHEPKCGFTADIIKAFNCIPRSPTLAIAIRKGLHHRIVRAWTGALTGFARRFRVRPRCTPQRACPRAVLCPVWECSW